MGSALSSVKKSLSRHEETGIGRAASAEGHQYSKNRRADPAGFTRASSEGGGSGFNAARLVSDSWDDGAPTGGPQRKEDSFGLPQNMRGSSDQSVGVESKDPDKPGFGCSSIQGHRGNMEDGHIAVQSVTVQGEKCSLFAVFDGHGGVNAANFLVKKMVNHVKKALEANISDPQSALSAAFLSADQAFLDSGDYEKYEKEDGATAVLVLLMRGVCYCANAGDSRAVLYRAGGVVMPLSVDHKPGRPDEKRRVSELGGCIIFGRVLGRLAVSRAIGDMSMKPFVTAEPEVTKIDLRKGDEFIVLACDGLWDVTDNQTAREVVQFHLAARGAKAAAVALTTYAVRKGSMDNVTAMVVNLGYMTSTLGELVVGEEPVWHPKPPELEAAKKPSRCPSGEDDQDVGDGDMKQRTSL